jgi:acetyl-CoA carboxylase biotin carboxyl carrier protein
MSDPIRPEEIEALVAEFDASDCTELHVRFEGFELHLSNDAAARSPDHEPATIAAPSAREMSETPRPASATMGGPTGADDLEGFEIVCAPYLGTFYRAPKPGDPVYVEVGSKVSAESEVCLVEVMKLFTAVRAGVGGTIARVLANDGQTVEAGQPLFAIDVKG